MQGWHVPCRHKHSSSRTIGRVPTFAKEKSFFHCCSLIGLELPTLWAYFHWRCDAWWLIRFQVGKVEQAGKGLGYWMVTASGRECDMSHLTDPNANSARNCSTVSSFSNQLYLRSTIGKGCNTYTSTDGWRCGKTCRVLRCCPTSKLELNLVIQLFDDWTQGSGLLSVQIFSLTLQLPTKHCKTRRVYMIRLKSFQAVQLLTSTTFIVSHFAKLRAVSIFLLKSERPSTVWSLIQCFWYGRNRLWPMERYIASVTVQIYTWWSKDWSQVRDYPNIPVFHMPYSTLWDNRNSRAYD